MVDERVPKELKRIATDISSGRLPTSGTPVDGVVRSVSADPVVDNVFVLAMLGAGIVLVILMVKT